MDGGVRIPTLVFKRDSALRSYPRLIGYPSFCLQCICGQLYFPEMATKTTHIRHALITVWLSHSSHWKVRSSSFPLDLRWGYKRCLRLLLVLLGHLLLEPSYHAVRKPKLPWEWGLHGEESVDSTNLPAIWEWAILKVNSPASSNPPSWRLLEWKWAVLTEPCPSYRLISKINDGGGLKPLTSWDGFVKQQ